LDIVNTAPAEPEARDGDATSAAQSESAEIAAGMKRDEAGFDREEREKGFAIPDILFLSVRSVKKRFRRAVATFNP
jgi:hypothetical protein